MKTATSSPASACPIKRCRSARSPAGISARRSSGNPTAIVPLLGSLIPFAKTAADRAGDPRKSLDERYRGKADYLGRVTEAGLALVSRGMCCARICRSCSNAPPPAGTGGLSRPAVNIGAAVNCDTVSVL